MAAILWLNILLTTPFLGLWVGIPLWLVLRHPDARPAIKPAPAGRVPDARAEHPGYQRVA
jgi:hypothetical protein